MPLSNGNRSGLKEKRAHVQQISCHICDYLSSRRKHETVSIYDKLVFLTLHFLKIVLRPTASITSQ